MPVEYKYRAVAGNGQPQSGTITAESNQQVLEYLSEQHLLPVSIKVVSKRPLFSLWGFFRGSQYDALIMFTSNLSTLYKAGVPLLRALSIIRIGGRQSRFNYAISQMRLSLQSGKSLSSAMAEFDDLFPGYCTASVAAGEESGKLDDILDELTLMMEKELELTRQIKSGVRYPLMVVSALLAAFVIMMTFVVPRFVEFYGAFNVDLPLFTRLLIGVSNAFDRYWPVLPVLIAAAIFGFHKATSNEKARLAVDRFLIRLPVIGKLVIKGNVARFALMFRILLKSGLPIVKSLDILNGAIKNSQVAREIMKIRDLFREGRDDLLTSENFAVFPELALQMMSIGLESGSLEKMLTEVGRHYSKEVQYMSRHLASILEPILTVVLGGFVLILALAIFLPMWNLIQVFRGP